MRRLRQTLQRIDGRSYREYKALRGRYDFEGFELFIDHVQGDPFAAPSQLRIEVPPERAGFTRQDLEPFSRLVATEDFLTRSFARACRRIVPRSSGSGKSGRFEVLRCGQEILERTSCQILDDDALRFRFTLGLPASGRRVRGREAWTLLGEVLPELVEAALIRKNLDISDLEKHLDVAEDQEFLREQLAQRELVAFIADGAKLPRQSGAHDEPSEEEVVPFEAPESLAVELETRHHGLIRGLGFRRGVTLIVGGGYHGKSTVLNTIARAVYPHIPGDGREQCVTDPDAIVIRAEDGRSVSSVDIRPFIDGLPLGRKTEWFSTVDASGSTSQAAAIIEGRESGAKVLLIDEDTAATNFMIRDQRMRRLVPDAREPITPFIERVRMLADEGISTVLVLGGAGDYLDVADQVICLDEYRPQDVTRRARDIARELPLTNSPIRKEEGRFPIIAPRVPIQGSLDPRKGKKPQRVKAVRTREILFGIEEIDVTFVEQIIDPAQARAIGDALLWLSVDRVDGERSLESLLDELDEVMDKQGLAALLPRAAGDRARPRRHEIAAALNRLRSLKIRERRCSLS